MPAYVIAERLKAWDLAVFEQYGPAAAASIARFGGRYIALSDAAVSLEGGPTPLTMAIIEFPTIEDAQAWYASDEYQAAAAIRRRGASNRFVALPAGAVASRAAADRETAA